MDWGEGGEGKGGLTLDVIFRHRLRRFLIVDQLHHGQEVVFAQALEVVRELVHVDLPNALAQLVLLGDGDGVGG